MLDEVVASSSSYAQPSISGNSIPQLDERLMAGLQFIDIHYNQAPLSLRAVSKSAGLSVWYFSRLFNAHIGMGFREYLKSIRLRHACKLLATSKLTIKEIAAMVGYTHLSDFYHHFKERVDVSPAVYRRGARNAYMNSFGAMEPNKKQ
jgi:AraC-like DNA-binding protein